MNKPLYDRDFYAWTQAQADALRRRSANELDWENLQEEIESMGKKEAREFQRRLAILIAHVLKWRTQPELRSRSWVATIRVQQRDIPRLMEDNPSLKAYLDRTLAEALDEGREIAAVEMGRVESDLEWSGAFTLEDLMAFDPDAER